MRERWLVVPGHPDYEVSDHGRIMSYKRRTPRLMTPCLDKNGYRFTTLDNKTLRFASVVLLAFVGPRPEGHQTCHKDDDPGNDHLSNLRWDTGHGNAADRRENGGYGDGRCPLGHWRYGPNRLETGRSGACRACRRTHNAVCKERQRHGVEWTADEFKAYADTQYARIMGTADTLTRVRSTEAARAVGISGVYLTQLARDGHVVPAAVSPAGHRYWDVERLRQDLAAYRATIRTWADMGRVDGRMSA